MKGIKVMFKGALCSNEVGEGGEREEGRVGARNRREARERGQTDIRIIVHTSLHSPHPDRDTSQTPAPILSEHTTTKLLSES